MDCGCDGPHAAPRCSVDPSSNDFHGGADALGETRDVVWVIPNAGRSNPNAAFGAWSIGSATASYTVGHVRATSGSSVLYVLYTQCTAVQHAT